MWKLFILLFLLPAASCGLRVVSTDPGVELPHRTGEVEVENSSLHLYPEFTICSRFKTYQFTTYPDNYPFQVVLHLNNHLTFLACFVAVPCSVAGQKDCTLQVQNINSNVPGGWKQGKVFGISQSGDWERYVSYPAWQPDTWNTACLTLSAPGRHYQVRLNGQVMGRVKGYRGEHREARGENIRLMNSGGAWDWFPLHGAVTDLAVWDRILNNTELTAWERCEEVGPGPGNIVSWDSVELTLRNIAESTVSRSELCEAATARENIQAFSNKNDFDGSQRFCQSMGAKIAVAEDGGSFNLMKRTQSKVCDAGWFYAGYTEVGGENQWRDVNTGRSLTWGNWIKGEPNNWGGYEDCVGSDQDGGFFDIKCEAKTCPICKERFLQK